MSKDNLTEKQRKFAQKYIELGNASEAYRQSYNAKNMTDKQIWEEASKLNANPKVRQRVEDLRKKHAERHAVTVESITKEYEEARTLALLEKQPSAAVSATTGKAKLHGLVVEKKDVKISPLETILEELDGTSADLPED